MRRCTHLPPIVHVTSAMTQTKFQNCTAVGVVEAAVLVVLAELENLPNGNHWPTTEKTATQLHPQPQPKDPSNAIPQVSVITRMCLQASRHKVGTHGAGK